MFGTLITRKINVNTLHVIRFYRLTNITVSISLPFNFELYCKAYALKCSYQQKLLLEPMLWGCLLNTDPLNMLRIVLFGLIYPHPYSKILLWCNFADAYIITVFGLHKKYILRKYLGKLQFRIVHKCFQGDEFSPIFISL